MTLNRRILKRVHSPLKSPKRMNTSIRKKALLKQLGSDVHFGTSKANVKVVIRIRPYNSRELENGSRSVVKVVDEHMLIFDPKEDEEDFFFKGVRQRTRDLNRRPHREQKFVFERVFNEISTNDMVYEETTKDIIDTILSGYNCSVFAYGATGAGKTYTMLGKPECPGITFLTLMELYRRIEELKEDKTCEVGVSYLEVYNEMVRDLLRPGKPLNVQENGSQVLVPGLSLHKPKDADDILKMLEYGNQNRTQHPTDANAESSRSHAVFQIFVRQQDRTANLKNNVCIAKLSMIDLAGSERGAATGFKGARFREGANINKSLLALGNCINALADGLRHVPYRDSKLTRLLKDSLGGNCRSVMIAAISPSSLTFEDTFNTLRYANRAKTIKTTLKKNLINVDQHVSQYVKIVEDLREEICSLKEKVKQYEEKDTLPENDQLELQQARVSLERQNELENEIAALQKQLEVKVAETKMAQASSFFTTEEEQAVQNSLKDLSLQRKALRRDLLQLESSQRELELKIHNCNLRLQRMKILSPASHRLDKSISKCERSIRNFTDRLEQTKKLQETIAGKLETNFEKLNSVKNDLNQWGQEPFKPSQPSKYLIEKTEASLIEHDLGRYSEHLKEMLKESCTEHNSTEHLVGQLLHVVKKFYIQLRANNVCLPEMEQLFEGVIDSMDESKILWEDQQSNKTCPSNEMPQPRLDFVRLSHLPLLAGVYISPTLPQESNKVFRRSIMKTSKSTSSVPSIISKTEVANVFEDNEFPISPLVSAYNVSFTEEHKSLPVDISADARSSPSNASCLASDAHAGSPMNNSEGSEPSYTGSLPSITTTGLLTGASATPGPHIKLSTVSESCLSGSSQNGKGDDVKPVFVSMVEQQREQKENICDTSAIGNLSVTELIEESQPVEGSMNATFAITPAKTLNVTMDMPCASILDTTVDLKPKPLPYTCLSTTKAFKTDEITNPSIRSCIDGVMASCTKMANTTIDISALSSSESKENSASKMLFQQETLDSTYSIDNTSFGCSPLESVSPVLGLVSQNSKIKQTRSPLLPLENLQHTSKQVLKDPASLGSKNTLIAPPNSSRKVAIKCSKTPKIMLPPESKGLSLTKTPKTSSGNGLRRSLSTSALNGRLLNNSSKQVQESPVFKSKYAFGSVWSKTTNFVKMKNQENVPPSNDRYYTPNHKSLVHKETVSSLAKHALKHHQNT